MQSICLFPQRIFENIIILYIEQLSPNTILEESDESSEYEAVIKKPHFFILSQAIIPFLSFFFCVRNLNKQTVYGLIELMHKNKKNTIHS